MPNFWQLATTSNSQNLIISFDYSWLLAINLSNFASFPWNIYNQYCHHITDPPADLQGNANDSLESNLYEIVERKLRQRYQELHNTQNDVVIRMLQNTVMDVINGKCGFTGGALMALYACDVKQQVTSTLTILLIFDGMILNVFRL